MRRHIQFCTDSLKSQHIFIAQGNKSLKIHPKIAFSHKRNGKIITIKVKKTLKTAFLYIGTLIGAGFSSGREIALFFKNLAPYNVALSAVVMSLFALLFLTAGRLKLLPQGKLVGVGIFFSASVSLVAMLAGGFRIYIAGDTEDIPEMAAIKDIDVAFLPVNQPYTMTVDQCVNAAKVIRPKVLIPYHFSQTDLSGLPEQLPGITVLLRQMQ